MLWHRRGSEQITPSDAWQVGAFEQLCQVLTGHKTWAPLDSDDHAEWLEEALCQGDQREQ